MNKTKFFNFHSFFSLLTAAACLMGACFSDLNEDNSNDMERVEMEKEIFDAKEHVLTLDHLYLLSCNQCRISGGISLFNKFSDDLFYLICSFAFFPMFTFMDNHPLFITKDNGMTVICPPGGDKSLQTKIFKELKHGTIKFGKYLRSKDKIIYKVTFNTLECDPEFIGFGFLKNTFNSWNNGNLFNFNGNGSIMCYQDYLSRKQIEQFENTIFNRLWFKKGDNITYELNMCYMKGIIWNSTTSNKEKPIFEMDLIDNIAIGICMGGKTQTIKVANQEIISDKT